MNRKLAIPAGCCLVAYVAVFTILHGSPSESAERARRLPDASQTSLPAAVSAVPVPSAAIPTGPYGSSPASLLSRADAEKLLQTLNDDYLRPHRTWEASPHRLMSRAIVRVEPSSAQYVLATHQPGDHELLATLVIKFGSKSQTFPCVIDRVTKGVCVFANGQWTQAEEWLKTAPAPLR